MDQITQLWAWSIARHKMVKGKRAGWLARGPLSDVDSGWYSGYLAALESIQYQIDKLQSGQSIIVDDNE